MAASQQTQADSVTQTSNSLKLMSEKFISIHTPVNLVVHQTNLANAYYKMIISF